MRYRFYTVSADAWAAMLKAIRAARHSIYWESYILLDDTPTHNFFEALKKKARQGLRVKIIADAVGSFWLGSQAQKELKAAGAEILFFNRLLPWWEMRRFRYWWFCRNHKKILVIDENIGFLGGVNVGERFRHWLDLHLEMRGLIVRRLLRSFIKSYRLCGGKDKLVLRRTNILKTKTHFFDHWPSWRRQRSLKRYYLQAIRSAEEKIIIATPYFVPHRWLVKALHKAVRRRVAVEIILPKVTDFRLVTWANYIFASLTKRRGIDFYFTSKMIHAKSLLIDSKLALVGSMNIDAQSFDFNAESGVLFQRKDMTSRLKKIIENWKKDAEKFYFTPEKKHWYQKLAEAFFKMLQPIL